MTDIFVDTTNNKGDFAGVFEADDSTSYFYLYQLVDGANGQILGAVQVYRGVPNFVAADVAVRWLDDETKVAVFIKDELGAYFDLRSGRGYPGSYSRAQPKS